MLRRRRGEIRFGSQFAGILLSVLLPAVIVIITLPNSKIPMLLGVTGIGCAIAAFIALYMMQGVTRYPGVEATASVLPAFSISYGLLLAIFILSRLDYSRAMLLGSFGITVAWFLFLYSRRVNMRIGVVPDGLYIARTSYPGIEWITLEAPDADVSDLDAVAADLREDFSNDWERRFADYALMGLPVYHTKHLLESLSGRVDLETLWENDFGTLSPASRYMPIKHLGDWIMALMALIVLAPALGLIAILVKLDSPGPIIFRQTRMGYRGKPFTVYKFRSMSAAPAPESDQLRDAITQAGDLRVTRFGRFIRKSRIDELPQIFNILKNQMSWIGPRPEAVVLSQWYEQEIPFYRYRHIVRPGITGWAQVNQGHVAEIDEVKSKLDYDFYYIKNFSPIMDLLIAIRTLHTVLTGFGAR